MDKRAEADLARSGITPEQAEHAGFFDVEDASTVYKDFKKLPAIIIPYFTADGEPKTFERDGETVPFCRVRYLKDPSENTGSFKKQKALRYSQPKASGVHAYFPQVANLNWTEVLADKDMPILITEGEKKATAACLVGAPTIGLGGVYNFMHEGNLIPELEDIPIQDRSIYICYDSDAALNPNIQAAEGKLTEELKQKRGARVYLVRLPSKGDEKIGIDDYLVQNGSDSFFDLLEEVPSLNDVDAAMVALNNYVAWIERDGGIYDLESGFFMRKDDFTRGSQYSTLKVKQVVQTGKKGGYKDIPVAATWLTHPHAQRYADLLFRPDEEETVLTENGERALNSWKPWDSVPGDVEPFLELSEFLFSRMPSAHRELPLNLMAYKAQNPAEKVPLALVLIGQQGCGKSLWGECIREAFDPYGVELASSSINDPFQGWLERSLVAVINEADADDLIHGRDRLKALISDLVRPMNEKYRVARQIRTYTQYILTSNSRRVGAYSADDRRMVVIPCPNKREQEFYDKISAWKQNNGPKKLLHWLLSLDLSSFKVPQAAPMTAEKHMAYMESLTPAQRLAEDMKVAGEHAIVMWCDAALEWAETAEMSSNPLQARQARETIDAIGAFHVRPFYTPEEIARLFPSIVATLHGNKRVGATVAGEISRELREAGIPYLENKDDPRGFKWRGSIHQFLVVADMDDWSMPMSQEDFERYMQRFPRYSEVRAKVTPFKKKKL